MCGNVKLIEVHVHRSSELDSTTQIVFSSSSRLSSLNSKIFCEKRVKFFDRILLQTILFEQGVLFVCLFVYLFILGRKLNRQNCLLKEVLREREEKEEKEKKKSN